MRHHYRNIRAFALRNRRHAPTAALVTGFIWDNLTLGRPDQLFDNAVMLFYLFFVGGVIMFLNKVRESGRTPSLWYLIIIQFSFGNLASGLFVLYGVSGTLVGNWPFFLLLASLIIGNEFFKRRYLYLRLNILIYYVLLFSYVMLVMPILLGEIGPVAFLLSGFAALVLIVLFIGGVYLVAPNMVRTSIRFITFGIGTIFLTFNALYFTHLIPPVPLALRDIEIYHHVERDTLGNYVVTREKKGWYEFWKWFDSTFYYATDARAYCFTSVFAPARISTPIFHVWERFDEEADAWLPETRVSFSIVGGRDDGYRGHSVKTIEGAERWRCSVETARGALIGRTTFNVERVATAPEMVTEVR